MCNNKGFFLFNQRVIIGFIIFYIECYFGVEGSLVNFFFNIWKVLGISLSGWGGKYNDYGLQNKVCFFFFIVGIRNARMGRLIESLFLGL